MGYRLITRLLGGGDGDLAVAVHDNNWSFMGIIDWIGRELPKFWDE